MLAHARGCRAHSRSSRGATSAADVAAADDFLGGVAAQLSSSEDFFANGITVLAAEGSVASSATNVNEAEPFGAEAAAASSSPTVQP